MTILYMGAGEEDADGMEGPRSKAAKYGDIGRHVTGHS